jgi:ADP-dependent NAD(P)H-hydrate dehydratase / NAD(P)H-hydrate epimerase
MQRISRPQHALPLYDVATLRGVEARAQAEVGPNVLMQRAGLQLARLALALAPHARTIWVAAGPGNNGGDGIEAALHLHQWGKRVALSSLADPASQPADARAACERARAAGVPISPVSDLGFVPDLAIDALLGIGANRAPDARIAAWIRILNALPCPVLAVDIPSGLSADTGAALGPDCVVARHTLSLLALKPGLFTGVGRDHVGDLWFDHLQVAAAGAAPVARLSGASQAVLAQRRHAQHKGSFGDAAVIGGATGMVGAALLAARAAHAAGAGRVFVDLLDPQGPSFDAACPELMLRPGWAEGAPDALRTTLAICGCGAGDAARQVLPRLLSQVPRLLLDADALNAIGSDTALQGQLEARAGRGHVTVLTPHPLEAARLLGCSTAQVQADRLGAATRLAGRFQAVIVLKGSGTVIAAPDRTPHLNPTGNAGLASAGSGDVLAGWLGGCWSQAAASGGVDAAFSTACSAVYRHGLAAHGVDSGALRATELIERLHDQARASSA